MKYLAALLLLALSACSSMPTFNAESSAQKLMQAESTANTAKSMAATLLTSKSITFGEEQGVRKTADAVIAGAEVGRPMTEAGAAAQYSSIQTDLGFLQSFIAKYYAVVPPAAMQPVAAPK
jgi:hypothetical protein